MTLDDMIARLTAMRARIGDDPVDIICSCVGVGFAVIKDVEYDPRVGDDVEIVCEIVSPWDKDD